MEKESLKDLETMLADPFLSPLVKLTPQVSPVSPENRQGLLEQLCLTWKLR